MGGIDRRVFVQRAAIAGAAAGAAWVAPAVTGASTAFAGTSCVAAVDETALSGWTRSGGGGTGTTLTKSYAALGGKPALTATFTVTSTSGSIDSANLSRNADTLSYGGTSPNVLVKGTPAGGLGSGVQGWIEVVLSFSTGVTNLSFDIQNISGFGLAGSYRRWNVWLSGAANTDPPPAFTFTPTSVSGTGLRTSPWVRNAKAYGAAAVSMVGSNANPVTYVKFHFDMNKDWADSVPGAMDAGIANLKFCR